MNTTFATILEIVGTLAFAISGIRLAAAKQFDWFGAYAVGLVTAIGGGTLRDVLLNATPFWMINGSYLTVTAIALIFVIIFKQYLVKLENTFFIFDTIGALKFYSSVRLDVRKIETLKQNGEVIGNRTRVKIVKNKVAPPFREAEFDILFGKGISTEGDLVDLASNAGIIQKSGAWFSYEGNKIGQGRENAKQFLLDNPEIREEVDRRVREHYGIVDGVKEAEASDDAKQTKAKKKADTEE